MKTKFAILVVAASFAIIGGLPALVIPAMATDLIRNDAMIVD